MRAFRSMCAWSANNIDAKEFTLGLTTIGLDLSKSEQKRLFEALGGGSDGLIEFEGFEKFLWADPPRDHDGGGARAATARSGGGGGGGGGSNGTGARTGGGGGGVLPVNSGAVETELERELEARHADRAEIARRRRPAGGHPVLAADLRHDPRGDMRIDARNRTLDAGPVSGGRDPWAEQIAGEHATQTAQVGRGRGSAPGLEVSGRGF